MKRIILMTIIVGMVGWSIYEFVTSKNEVEEAQIEEETPHIHDGSGENLQVIDEGQIGFNRGDIAPDFQLQTLTGETVALSDFRGKRVMLNFWATWCPPCRAEMPDMQKLYEEYDDIVILAVNLLETEEDLLDDFTAEQKVEQFVEKFELTFPILLDEKTAVAHLYQIQPIPSSFMIDADGRIQNVALGAVNYELMVQMFERMK